MNPVLIFCYIYCFVFGSCIASFMNVIIYRLPLGLPIAKGRSFCSECHHTLHAIDMVPVFSWIFLRGKCRYCGAKLSIRHPLIETAGGLLAMFSFYRYGFSMMTPLCFALCAILLAIFMIDIDTMTIPDSLNIAVGVVAVISMFFTNVPILSRIIGFFMMSGFMVIVNLIHEDSFGGGDIKLCAPLGFMLGATNMLVGMFIAIITAGLFAVVLLLSNNVKLQQHMAFGPFICVGGLIGLTYGSTLLSMYLSLFGI